MARRSAAKKGKAVRVRSKPSESGRGRLLELSPEQIGPNLENPRLHFPEGSLDSLAESIEKEGVLVPVSVYENRDGTPPYILVDGERRWQCAKRLGVRTIPAILIPKPDDVTNLRTMFHIHNVREPWNDMPTAWALKKLMERTGQTDPEELRLSTGLSIERVKRLQFTLDLPKRYQELIDSGKVPLNYFYELERNVIRPLQRLRPQLFNQLGEGPIRESFVQKYLEEVTPDTVELRRVRPIITVAASEAGSPEGTSDLDDFILDLIQTKERTIQEAYENTVEMIVEAKKFAQRCRLLIVSLDRLMKKAQSEDDRELVISAVRGLVDALNIRFVELEARSPRP